MSTTVKRTLCTFVALILLFGLIGCADSQTPRMDSEHPSPVSSDSNNLPTDNATHQPVAPEDVKVAFVAIAPPTEYGYNLSVYNGYQYVVEHLPDIETVWIDNVPDVGNESETVMERLVRDGCNVIFAVSFGYMDNTAKLAERYPEVYFAHCSQGPVYVPNMTRYDITTYDTSFVAGYLAGKMTKTNQLGYVSAQPIPTVLSAANGYALGAKLANPDAKVNLFFTNSWSDPSLEKEAAQSLVENGCDVLAQFADSPSVQQVAKDNGVYSVGFHVDMRQFAPDNNLTSFVYNWGPLYAQEIQKYIDGDWTAIETAPGLIEGYADIAPMNEAIIPADIIAEVEDIRQQIIDGDIVVYAGEIKDNEGHVRVAEGEVLSGDDLKAMDWLVDNITGATLK